MSDYSKPSLTPSELANQIRLFLAENRGGQPAARLAWRFTRAIENAKLDADEIAKLIRDRNLIEAFLLANAEPPLAEVIGELTLPEATPWKADCELYHRSIPSNLDPQIVSDFSDAFPAKRERDEWLLDEYRSRKEAGELTEAYPIIRFLSKQPSSNSAIAGEHAEVKAVIIQRASTQITKLLKQDANSSLIASELDYFRSYDLSITSDLGPVFENAISIERTRQKVLALEKVQSFLESVDSSNLDGLSWIPHENLYFSYDGLINRQDLRWLLPKELIQNFSIYAEQLSELRLNFEKNVKPKQRVIPAPPPVAKQEKLTEEAIANEQSLEDETVQDAAPEPAIELLPEAIPAVASNRQKPENDQSPDERPLSKTNPAAEVTEAPDPIGETDSTERSAEIPPPTITEHPAPSAPGCETQANLGAALEDTADTQKADQRKGAPERSALYPRLLYTVLPLGTAAAIAFFFLPAKPSSNPTSRVTIEQPVKQHETVEPKPVEPQVKYVEAAPYENRRYDEFVRNLTEILEGNLDHSRMAEVENLLSEIDNEIQEMPIKEAEKRTVTYNSLLIASKAIRREIVSQLIKASKQDYDAYEKRIEILTASIGGEDFIELEERAIEARDTHLEKAAIIRQLDPAAVAPSLVGLDQSFDIAKRRNQAILTERESLMASRTIKEYFEKLDTLAALPNSPTEEVEKLAQAARLSGNVETAITQLRQIPVTADISKIIAELKNSASGQELEFIEKAMLDNLVRVAKFHSEVFEIKELYYKGKRGPYSEQTLLVHGRPQESGDKNQTSTEITLFNSDGTSRAGPVSKNYMVDQYDNPWGYKYSSPVKTAEANYCENHITPILNTLSQQTNQTVVLELVDDINQRSDLSSSFRAYWTFKLFEFSAERKWHWGQAFSQTFTDAGSKLAKLDRSEKSAWIKERLHNLPQDQKLEAILASLAETSLADEAHAILELWDFSENCEFKPVGYVTKDGIPSFPQLDTASEAALWTVNLENNEMERLSESRSSLPYSPILSAKRSEIDSAQFVSRLSNEYGVDLKADRYRHLIPSLFHSSN